MPIFNWLPQMPFTDLHQLNLDWLISKYKKLEDDEATIQASLEGAEAAKEDAEAAATDAANSATAAAGSAAEASRVADSWLETDTFTSELTRVTDEYLNEHGVIINYDEITNNPVDGYVLDLANGDDVYRTTQFDGQCVMGDVHSVGYDIYNPHPSANTAYYPAYFNNTFKVYFDDTIYKVNIAGYDENKVYEDKVNPVLTSPATINSISVPGLASCPWFAVEIRNRDNSTLDLAAVNAAGIYVETLVAENIARPVYVSPNGSDSNNGKTRSAAFATIQKAIDTGTKKIIVKSGTYNSGFTMLDLYGVSIELDRYYDSFSPGTSEESPKIVINTTATAGVTITNCYDCTFESIEVKNCTSQGWRIDKSAGLTFRDCIADNIGIGATSGGGFVITHTNADFYNCGAYNIGTTTASTNPTYHLDGFNIHETGTTNFINCWAYNCLDDGVSHHDACYGYIDGGEWYGCGKGGVASPTHGAHIDVRNIYSHNNGFGIYAQTDDAVQTRRAAINITNCVCKNNRTKDISVENPYYTANVWNCIYGTSEGFTPLT